MYGIWKKTLKRCLHDSKGLTKAVAEIADSFNQGGEEGDMEELLEVVLKETTE